MVWETDHNRPAATRPLKPIVNPMAVGTMLERNTSLLMVSELAR